MAHGVTLELREEPLGILLPIEIRAHQEARSRGGREGRRELQFRVITASQTLIGPCPGEVEYEFAEGVSLDERRRRCGEAPPVAQCEVARLPARTGSNAARALESGEELIAREGIIGRAERIPLRRAQRLDAVVVLGPVHVDFRDAKDRKSTR